MASSRIWTIGASLQDYEVDGTEPTDVNWICLGGRWPCSTCEIGRQHGCHGRQGCSGTSSFGQTGKARKTSTWEAATRSDAATAPKTTSTIRCWTTSRIGWSCSRWSRSRTCHCGCRACSPCIFGGVGPWRPLLPWIPSSWRRWRCSSPTWIAGWGGVAYIFKNAGRGQRGEWLCGLRRMWSASRRSWRSMWHLRSQVGTPILGTFFDGSTVGSGDVLFGLWYQASRSNGWRALEMEDNVVWRPETSSSGIRGWRSTRPSLAVLGGAGKDARGGPGRSTSGRMSWEALSLEQSGRSEDRWIRGRGDNITRGAPDLHGPPSWSPTRLTTMERSFGKGIELFGWPHWHHQKGGCWLPFSGTRLWSDADCTSQDCSYDQGTPWCPEDSHRCVRQPSGRCPQDQWRWTAEAQVWAGESIVRRWPWWGGPAMCSETHREPGLVSRHYWCANGLFVGPSAPRQEAQHSLLVVRPPALLREAGLATEKERWVIQKALYGLDSSPKNWADYRDSEFRKISWTSSSRTFWLTQCPERNLWRILSRADSQMHQLEIDDEEAKTEGYVVVYVDDLLIVGSSTTVQEGLNRIRSQWECSEPSWVNSGDWTRFCGLELRWRGDNLLLGQPAYAKELGQRHGDLPPKLTPLPKIDGDLEPEVDPSIDDVRRAQGLVGELLWLSVRSRPDLSYAISLMGRHVTRCPKKVLELGDHVLGYVQQTWDQALSYGPCSEDWGEPGGDGCDDLGRGISLRDLQVFSDASHAPGGRRPDCHVGRGSSSMGKPTAALWDFVFYGIWTGGLRRGTDHWWISWVRDPVPLPHDGPSLWLDRRQSFRTPTPSGPWWALAYPTLEAKSLRP